jgi:hypothetical protein
MLGRPPGGEAWGGPQDGNPHRRMAVSHCKELNRERLDDVRNKRSAREIQTSECSTFARTT